MFGIEETYDGYIAAYCEYDIGFRVLFGGLLKLVQGFEES